MLYDCPFANGCCCLKQIGFLTEWQMYAQKIEGDQWLGERLDDGVIQKMSGTCRLLGKITRMGRLSGCHQINSLDSCMSSCKPFRSRGKTGMRAEMA